MNFNFFNFSVSFFETLNKYFKFKGYYKNNFFICHLSNLGNLILIGFMIIFCALWKGMLIYFKDINYANSLISGLFSVEFELIMALGVLVFTAILLFRLYDGGKFSELWIVSILFSNALILNYVYKIIWILAIGTLMYKQLGGIFSDKKILKK